MCRVTYECHVWMLVSHTNITFECVVSHKNVTYKCVVSHKNVTYECIVWHKMSHRMRCVTYECVVSHVNVTYECVVSHTFWHASWTRDVSPVTRERHVFTIRMNMAHVSVAWVMPHMNDMTPTQARTCAHDSRLLTHNTFGCTYTSLTTHDWVTALTTQNWVVSYVWWVMCAQHLRMHTHITHDT